MDKPSRSNKKRVLPDNFVGSAKRVSAAPSTPDRPKKRRIAKNARSPKKKTVPVNDENAPPNNNTVEAAKGKPEEGQNESTQPVITPTLQKKTTGNKENKKGVLLKRENGMQSARASKRSNPCKSDSVMQGSIFHDIDARQFSVCSVFRHHEHIGTGFYIKQIPVCSCGSVCNCRLVCTCYHVVKGNLPDNFEESIIRLTDLEGLKVNFHDHKGNIVTSIGVRDVLAFCPNLDYALLGLNASPCHVEPFSDYGNPPVPESYIHMVGFPEKPERMIETNLKVVNVPLFLEENFDMFRDEEEEELTHNHHLVYDCEFAHGSSGSPIFDDTGKVVGIHRKGFNDGNSGFRIKLGVKMVPVLRDANKRFGLFTYMGDGLDILYSQLSFSVTW